MKSKRPVIYGEVLYDLFPDGAEVLGGAPFNVAWHLQGLGLKPLMISRVGNDRRGDEIIAAMRDWDMAVSGIQRDPQHPTGTVSIKFEQDQPQFKINIDQAYDYIAPEKAFEFIQNTSIGMLYHGSLANRLLTSNRTLKKIISLLKVNTFFDINLRAPWWTKTLLKPFLVATHWLKLNREELITLATLFLDDKSDQLTHLGHRLKNQFKINSLIVTQGAQGAFVLSPDDEVLQESPPKQVAIKDTVGAGDAFSAVCIYGITTHWAWPKTLKRAVEFAGEICGIQGATTRDKSLYVATLNQWSQDDQKR